MSLFNRSNSNNTVNYEGAKARHLPAEAELYSAVVASMLAPSFYEWPEQRVHRIFSLVERVDPEFSARLAVYARTEMNMRSTPMVLLVALARCHSGDSLVSRAVAATVSRADEICELLAAYQHFNPRNAREPKKLGKLSNQIRLGLERAFNKFDEYQFAKYNVSGREVTLRDALFIVHPKPKDEAQQEIFNRIANRCLQIPYTWETQLSELGQQVFASEADKNLAKGELWEELVNSGRLGYMALLRNIRNIFLSARYLPDERFSTLISGICSRLSDPEQVAASKQLPFRFYSAYKEIYAMDFNPENDENAEDPFATQAAVKSIDCMRNMVLTALNDAVLASAVNVEQLVDAGRTLIAADVSGSMFFHLSGNSSIYGAEVGLVMASLACSLNPQSLMGLFGTIWRPYLLKSRNAFEITEYLMSQQREIGYATNGHLALEWLLERKLKVDSVFFFTDCQLWEDLTESWNRYRREINPEAKLYIFDLSGYGSIPFQTHPQGVTCIAGWSSRIFDLIEAEGNMVPALERIRRIVL